MQVGQLQKADYMDNIGGINTSDSAFRIKDSQTPAGINFDYTQQGSIRKRQGYTLINSVADGQTYTLGLSQYNSNIGTKFNVRIADTKIQSVDLSVPSFTNLTEDTSAVNSDFITASATNPILFSQFNTATSNVLWLGGPSASSIYGVYSASKVTKLGVNAPTASVFTATAGAGSSSLQTGTYRYTLVYRKASTQAISNAVLEASASVTATNDVTLAWTLTNNDTTKYDQIWVYRSALNGAIGFTTGDLIAQLASSVTGYVDTGTSILDAENIPRSGSSISDNSVLPSGTITALTTFKRRLVVAVDSQLCISEINKPESMAVSNYITIPSGGRITSLSVISFTSAQAQSLEEILVIHKEREVWVLTGDSLEDWVLKFIDSTGCASQASVVVANGFLTWLDYRGIYLWDGGSKPIYCSRPIESYFAEDGDIDKTKLNLIHSKFYKKQNVVIFYVSHAIYGEQRFAIKLDLRLTLPGVEQNLSGRVLDGVFTSDVVDFPVYAADTFLPTDTQNEKLLVGDSSGYLYYGYTSYSDNSNAYDFLYQTKFLDQNLPSETKRYHKVIVWVEELGSWNLTLDYWTGYQSTTLNRTSIALPISTAVGGDSALWDIALWDLASWDDYNPKLKPLVFNLHPGLQNANEGDCIKLQFRNSGADEPVTISGFSILYSIKGVTK